MGDSTFLQIFLLVNVFLVGVFTAVASRHAYAHFHPTHHEPEKPRAAAPPRVQLPPEVKERLLRTSQANFESILNRSAADLQHDLKATTIHLNTQLDKLGSKIVADEMQRYHTDLEQLRKQAETTLNKAQSDIGQHQTDIKSKLAEQQAQLESKLQEDIIAEKERLIQQIDTKLADAVASFLMETLQHNVDLGAQSVYLTALLDEHKDELISGVKNEA